MKKVLICLLLVIYIFDSMLFLNASSEQNSISIQYDNEWHEYEGNVFKVKVNNTFIQSPVPPIVFNGRSVVPAREVFEALGATVLWNNDLKTATVKYESTTIVLTINSRIATVNGNNVIMEIAPKIIAISSDPINGKTMIPVRFVSENINKSVDFISGDDIIVISDISPSPVPIPSPSPDIDNQTISTYGITGIDFQTDDTYTEVTITGTQDLSKYKKTILSSPDRLVLDFNGFVLKTDANELTINSSVISGARIGNHDGFVRVVLDLKDTAITPKITLSSSNKRFTILFKTPNPSPSESPKATPIPSTNPNGSPSPTANPNPTTSPDISSKIVVLDAGHGGSDPGALGKSNGETVLNEKVANIDITLKVEKILKDAGISVFLTRRTDTAVNLYDRPQIANALGADLFVSIHNNAIEDTSVNGSLVLYSTKQSADVLSGKKLADNVLFNLISSIGTKNLNTRAGDGFVVLKYTTMPAIIVEVAFVTNENDRNNLLQDNFKQKAAEGIAKGILSSLKQ